MKDKEILTTGSPDDLDIEERRIKKALALISNKYDLEAEPYLKRLNAIYKTRIARHRIWLNK